MSRIRPAYGQSAAIACGHPAAAAAGFEALAAGGSVADAAIAAGAVLAVVLPNAVSIGGDGFVLLHDAAAGRTFGLNASGRSPAKTDIAAFADGIPQRGPLSCTTPGLVGGFEALHRRFGRLPWASLFKRAVAMAEQGFPASAGLAAAAVSQHAVLARDPGATALLLGDNQPVAGKPFRQPALAATLRAIAEGGAEAFYRGAPAQSVERYLQSRGGVLAAEDFAAYAPEWVEPLSLPYRGFDVTVMPPNSYGLFMLLQFAALQTVDFAGAAIDGPRRFAALIAAARSAFAAGDGHVADPDVVGRGRPAILDPDGLGRLRAAFADRLGAAPPNQGGTAVVNVVDAQGNAVSLVESVYLSFGAGVADPESGVLLNNRMAGFTMRDGHPNRVAPRKRPAHTLNPVLTFADGRVRHAMATPGGPAQTLTITQVLQAVADHGLPLHEAVALPRWSMDLAGNAILEAGVPDATVAALQPMAVGRANPGSPFFGSAECVERLPAGGVVAVADARREAHAIAI